MSFYYQDADMAETLEGYVDDLNDCGRLTDWEMEFVDSMLKLRDSDAHLTDRQAAKICELHQRRCR